jgi:hypothetical protein
MLLNFSVLLIVSGLMTFIFGALADDAGGESGRKVIDVEIPCKQESVRTYDADSGDIRAGISVQWRELPALHG